MSRVPRHRHYLIFDSAVFQSLAEPGASRSPAPAFDQLHWESFLDRIATAFRAERVADRREEWAGSPRVYCVAQAPRLRVGIDQLGPDFVYVQPKSYDRLGGRILRAYRIDDEARAGFNRLIRACAEVRFSRIDRDGLAVVMTRYKP